MVTVTDSILIQEPIDDVFAFACDYRNDPVWRSGVKEMRVSPGGKTRVGSRTYEVMNFLGRRLHTSAEVISYMPENKVAFRSLDGPMKLTGSRSVSRRPEGTQFTYYLEADLKALK